MWEKLEISLPNKTFLAGEYLALWGGPALVINAEPRFALKVSRSLKRDQNNGNHKGKTDVFHPDSPAGRFVTTHQEAFAGYDFSFENSADIQGGFGRSSAEFASVHGLYQLHLDPSLLGEHPVDVSLALSDYRHCVDKISSGYDLVSQLTGGISFINRAHGNLKKYAWPFVDIGFSIFATGKKLQTHEHLSGLKIETSFSDEHKKRAEDCILKLEKSIQEIDSDLFVNNINRFGLWLREMNLVTESTLLALNRLATFPGVLAAKGCGALGSDAILVVYRNDDFKNIQKLAVNELGLHLVADQDQVTSGIEVKVYA